MYDRAASSERAPLRAPGRAAPAKTGLHLVTAPRNESRSRQLVFGLVLVVMFAALLASAVFHGVLVAGQQRLDRMDQRLSQRQQQLSRTQLRVAELTSPARLVATAQRSGMVVPARTIWLSATPPSTVPPAPQAGSPGSRSTGAELASPGGPTAPAARNSGSGHNR